MEYGQFKLPENKYHSLDLVSNSKLAILAKSPAHLKYNRTNPWLPTPAQELGTAIHSAILEPHAFSENYIASPKFDRRFKEQKALAAQWDSENCDKLKISQEDLTMCLDIATAVRSHSRAGRLVENANQIESSLIWQHKRTELDCKSRIDAICLNLKTVFDIKSTRSANRYHFEKAIFDFGYHRQGAFYIDACRALGIEIDHYAIIALEKTAPYGLMVYRLKDEVIDLGRRENESLLTLWKECEESDFWPSYPEETQDIGLPAWAQRRIEEDLVQ